MTADKIHRDDEEIMRWNLYHNTTNNDRIHTRHTRYNSSTSSSRVVTRCLIARRSVSMKNKLWKLENFPNVFQSEFQKYAFANISKTLERGTSRGTKVLQFQSYLQKTLSERKMPWCVQLLYRAQMADPNPNPIRITSPSSVCYYCLNRVFIIIVYCTPHTSIFEPA